MKFILIDYQPKGIQVNRDQTGTFGSDFKADGIIGSTLVKLKRTGVRLPIVSYSYAAALLRAHGHEVVVATDHSEFKADVAIFSTVMYYYKKDIAFLELFKKNNPSTLLGVVGAFSQIFPDYYLKCCDFVINGELESAAMLFLAGKWNWTGICNSGLVEDINNLPIPDWSGFPIANYTYKPALHRRAFLPIQTARGCSIDCNFCPYIISQGRKMRFRDLTLVEKEITLLVQKYFVKSLLFRDILFGVPKQRAIELGNIIRRQKQKIDWACEMHINSVDDQLIDHLSCSGLKAINLGIESSNKEILEASGKKSTTQAHIKHVVRYIESKNIRVQAFFMLGLWNDTAKSMLDTTNFAKELNTFSAQFCITTPFPGTQYFEAMKKHLIHKEWDKYTEYEAVMNLPNVTDEEVINARNHAFSTYYLRPAWITKHGVDIVKSMICER